MASSSAWTWWSQSRAWRSAFLYECLSTTSRNQVPQTAFMAQIVLIVWFLALDFGVVRPCSSTSYLCVLCLCPFSIKLHGLLVCFVPMPFFY